MHNLKRLMRIINWIALVAILAAGTFLAQPTAAQETEPRPHLRTSGAVGTPSSFQLPGGRTAAVTAAAAQSADDWTPDVTDGFESGLDNWQLFDESNDGLERAWGLDDSNVGSGSQAVWVAAGGGDGVDPVAFYYPNNLDSWLVYGSTIDLSSAQAADVEFSMWMETEAQYDWIFVGASTDGQNFRGDYWTGDSGGWQWYSMDLAEYIGQPQVYIAWYFHSDESNDADYEGVWLDDVTVWSYVNTGPAQVNDAVVNGDFESGDLSGWTVPQGSTVVVTEATNPNAGTQVAYFGGINDADEIFYQAIQIPANAASGRISFYANQFGREFEQGVDQFCAGLYSSDLSTRVLDLGCLDGASSFGQEFNPNGWWQVDYPIIGAEWDLIKGQVLNLVFEMVTNATYETTILIDDVVFETAAGGAPSDGNDSHASATPATLGQVMNNLSIDPALDQDFYSFNAAAGNTIAVDVDAAGSGSALDSFVEVQNAAGDVLCANDDDGSSRDAYVSCTALSAGTYYAVVRSYDGTGDRSYTYSLKITVAAGTVPTPTATPAPAETPTPPATNPKRAWTAMIYIAGDNDLCSSYPVLVDRMEKELHERIGANGFLNVLVLYDRNPNFCTGVSETTRLHIQPDANYQDNVNRWNMGEVNMGDPRTLVNFVTWAMQNYPADHYYLALDNHGNGIDGVAWDDTSNHDPITPDELYAAMKEITNNGQQKIDIFAYEACLMGLYENAYDIADFTKYIFFFSTIAWTNTASYPSYLGHANFGPSSDGRGLGEIMFDVTFEAVNNPMVLSLIDSSKMTALFSAVNAWGDALQTHLGGSAIAEARNEAQKIDADGNNVLNNTDYYVDLWSLADVMAARGFAVSQSNAVKAAVEAAVLKMNYRPGTPNVQVNYANAHGLTIYWPQWEFGSYSKYAGHQIYTSTRDGRWDDFLAAFMGGGAKRPGMGGSYGAIPKQSASFDIYLPYAVR